MSRHIRLAALLLTAVSCADGSASVRVVREMVGDTLIVRTMSGSEWGAQAALVPELSIGLLDGEEQYVFGSVPAIDVNESGDIYVLDRQVPAVRVYDSTGVHLHTVGRRGEGPGEFGRPDGMALLSDGRLVVRDPQNTRFQVFDAQLNPAGEWRVVPGGFSTSDPVRVARGDTVLTQVLMQRAAHLSDWRFGLMRVGPDGTVVDTVPVPETGYEAPTLIAERETDGGRSTSATPVPFSPMELAEYHRDGFFIYGFTADYGFTLLDPDSLRRFERAAEPIQVGSGERAAAEAQAIANMRRTDPNWRWDGPAIPSTKPPYKRILVGRDGRIWIVVSMPALEIDNPDYDPEADDSPRTVWREPTVFDVFESNGAYLGRVTAPDEFSAYPTPVMRGDRVWATTTDELGVTRVARYRIEVQPPS